jgi:hypothetical protein
MCGKARKGRERGEGRGEERNRDQEGRKGEINGPRSEPRMKYGDGRNGGIKTPIFCFKALNLFFRILFCGKRGSFKIPWKMD